jgi:glycosyltransferase involved in cell wall biosynthesis
MKVAFCEPYYGGSHRDVADNFARFSRHCVEVFSLPDINWGWRLRIAGMHLAGAIGDASRFDCIVATDLISVPDLTRFLAGSLAGPLPPVLLYFHENQLSYAGTNNKPPPVEHAVTDIKNAVAADRVVFNSRHHRDTFLEAARKFLLTVPDIDTSWIIPEIQSRSSVCYPGCDFTRFPPPEKVLSGTEPQKKGRTSRPIVLWNHRWAPDKNPRGFFRLIDRLEKDRIEFSIAVLGERFDPPPEYFLRFIETYEARIAHSAYIDDKDEYIRMLVSARVVISTAYEENFGISVLEATRAGCIPVLPRRLSYPELFPEHAHPTCLYRSSAEMHRMVRDLLTGKTNPDREKRRALIEAADRFRWENRITEFDTLIQDLVTSHRRKRTR